MKISDDWISEKLDIHFDDWMNAYSKAYINQLDLPESEKNTLISFGLPSGAAPEFQFNSSLKNYSDKYYLIGSGYSDNPIVIDKTTGEIFELTDNGKQLINKNLKSLLINLIEYAEMVEKSRNKSGKRAYLNNEIPSEYISDFEEKISSLENNSVFWKNEIKRLKK